MPSQTSALIELREIRHFHLFAGLGGGARGFNRGTARVGNMQAVFRCIGGVDVSPAAIKISVAFPAYQARCWTCSMPTSMRPSTASRRHQGGAQRHRKTSRPPRGANARISSSCRLHAKASRASSLKPLASPTNIRR